MTRRLFFYSALFLAATSVGIAKAQVSPRSTYRVVDLGAASDAERVAINEVGSILLTTETSTTKTAPTRLWVKGKTIPLPANFVGLAFGPFGAVYGYSRTSTGVTRAAIWKAGNVRELLAPEDTDNTRAIAASRNSIVVLVLSSGECGMVKGGTREIEEVGRATVGDAAAEPFRAVMISSNGTIVGGNQGERAYYYDSGAWQELFISAEAEGTVFTGMDSTARLMCGYIYSGRMALRKAWIRDQKNDDPDTEQIVLLQGLPGSNKDAYPSVTALAIGERGVGVVGFVSEEATPDMGARGVLWQGGKIFDLTRRLAPTFSDWIIKEARAISTTGSIVALAEQKGQRRIVLLVPNR